MKSEMISAITEGDNEFVEKNKVVLAKRTDGDYEDYAVGFDFVINDETKTIGLRFQNFAEAKDVFDQFREFLCDPVE